MSTASTLTPEQEAILRELDEFNIRTEFELINAVFVSCSKTRDVCNDNLSKWLLELRDQGLIWAGPLFTKSNSQKIWAAAITAAGREIIDRINMRAQTVAQE